MAEEIVISKEEYEQLVNQAQNQSEMFAAVMKMQNQLEEMQRQMDVFSLHFGRMYASQSIEETLQAMADLGKYEIGVKECDVYSVDAFDTSKLFTVDEAGKRVYLSLDEQSVLMQAVNSHEAVIMNTPTIVDGKNTSNILVVPLEDQHGDVIGLAVAKNKDRDFTIADVDAFNLKNGKIGNAFRMGLENKALQQKATTDALTHLANREGMNNFIKTEALPHIQHNEPVSVILLDIDHFKNFNDKYGHEVGDDCLKQVANILKDNVRQSTDSGVFRWGGEEMVVIVPVNEQKANEIADRLRKAVEQTPLEVNGEHIQVTVSGGVSQFKSNMSYGIDKTNILDEFDKVFEQADNALYFAKEHGRNQMCVHSNIEQNLLGNIDLAENIVASGNPENLWMPQEYETIVAYSGIGKSDYPDVISTFMSRAELSPDNADRLDEFRKLMKSSDIVANFTIDADKGVYAELELTEYGSLLSVPLTSEEQTLVKDEMTAFMEKNHIDIPDFFNNNSGHEPEKELLDPHEERMVQIATDKNGNKNPTELAEQFADMLSVVDYTIEKTEKGYTIFDTQTGDYIRSDTTGDTREYKNAEDIADRVSAAIDEVILSSVQDGIEETLKSFNKEIPDDFPTTAKELDEYLKTNQDIKSNMEEAGYDYDIGYVDLLANHLGDVNLDRLFEEKYYDAVWVDEYDADAVVYDDNLLDVHLCVNDDLLTDLIVNSDFDLGDQTESIRYLGHRPLDKEDAGIEYGDLYVDYDENKNPVYELNLQMSDDSKQCFFSDGKENNRLTVSDEMAAAIQNAVEQHFEKSLDEVIQDFQNQKEADTEHK